MEPRDLIEKLRVWRTQVKIKSNIWTKEDENVFKMLVDIVSTSWVKDFLIIIANIKNEEG